jgi:multiple antibiotic resistance protein
MQDMSLDIFLYAFTSFFVIIDPIGVSPIYGSLVVRLAKAEARKMAVKGVTIAASILTAFSFVGEDVLYNLGISIDAFRIAGGVFLFTTAFRMVTSQLSVSQEMVAEDEELSPAQKSAQKSAQDYSVYPLAIPLLAGPSAMTVVILLMTQAHTHPDPLFYQAHVYAALASVLLIAAICLSFAADVMRALGESGTAIFRRILGVLLAALSIQFMADGIKNMFYLTP